MLDSAFVRLTGAYIALSTMLAITADQAVQCMGTWIQHGKAPGENSSHPESVNSKRHALANVSTAVGHDRRRLALRRVGKGTPQYPTGGL